MNNLVKQTVIATVVAAPAPIIIGRLCHREWTMVVGLLGYAAAEVLAGILLYERSHRPEK